MGQIYPHATLRLWRIKKPSPYTNRQHTQTQIKVPEDDSNYGLSPTAHQLLQMKGRPPQGKITIGRKGNEKFFHVT